MVEGLLARAAVRLLLALLLEVASPMSRNRARWLRLYAAAFTFGAGALLLPLLWFAAARAYLAGDWQVVLQFNRLAEGPAEIVLLTVAVPVTWLGLIGFHELLRTAGDST